MMDGQLIIRGQSVKADPDKIRAFAKEGYSQSMIASLIGVSRERVRQICNRDGIECQSGKLDVDMRATISAVVTPDMTASQVAQISGYTAQQVHAVAHEMGLTLKKHRPELDKIIACAAAGMTLSETARHLGKSAQSVWNEGKRAGLKFQKSSAYKFPRRVWSDADVAAAKAMRANGASVREIAAHFNVSEGAMYMRFQSA